jgi:hypothetical protein
MIKNKKILHRTFVWFRFMIWWGSEAVRGTLAFNKRPKPGLRRLNDAVMPFSPSAWIFQKNGNYCMVLDRGSREIKVLQMPNLIEN